MEEIYPDYNNSIVNISSSIVKAFGFRTLYSPLQELRDLEEYENLILLIIDGLGDEFLNRYGKNSFLQTHYVKPVTSVFPSTTSAATTALETAVAPQQHGVLGWFMYLAEQNIIFSPWVFSPRIPQKHTVNIKRSDVFLKNRITDQINPSFLLYSDNMAKRQVNRNYDKLISYKTVEGMFEKIKESIMSSKNKKLIIAHWGGFDEICHSEGCSGSKTINHFLELDKKIAAFVNSIKNTSTTIIITSDHGQKDTEISKAINIDNHPELENTLRLPLCGEHRFSYCYVHPKKTDQFLRTWSLGVGTIFLAKLA